MMRNEKFIERIPATACLAGSETALRLRLSNLVRRHRVLDLACASGRWTEVASRAAEVIAATDPCDEQLALARRRRYDCRVSFAGTLDRAGALLPGPDCLLGCALFARLGVRAAQARIEQGLRLSGEAVTLVLLESGPPPIAALEALFPEAGALHVERAAFVTLISCRLGSDRPATPVPGPRTGSAHH